MSSFGVIGGETMLLEDSITAVNCQRNNHPNVLERGQNHGKLSVLTRFR